MGFFITTPAAEGQLELDLAEGRCPLDAQSDPARQGLALTLFTFDAVKSGGKAVQTEKDFRLATLLDVSSGCVMVAGLCLLVEV